MKLKKKDKRPSSPNATPSSTFRYPPTWEPLNCFLQSCLARKYQLPPTELTDRLLLMLNIVRRGPASTVTSLLFRSISSRCIRTTQTRDVQQCISRAAYEISARPFGTSTKWRQVAAAATAHEDEAVQSEVEQGFSLNEPPSNAQTKRPTNHGLVTKFKELAERGMVSGTVIDTLTRQMGLETMTHVQTLTINEILKGHDV